MQLRVDGNWNRGKNYRRYSLEIQFMKKILLSVFASLAGAAASLLCLASCANINSVGTAPAPVPKFSHPRAIANVYLPLGSLKQDMLQSKSERVERTARPEVHKIFQLGGQAVEALAVEDREYDSAGHLTEATLDYFAQADDGTVYYLGEDVNTYKDGRITGHAGGWLLGKETKTPGVLLPAHPKVGDRFQSENVPGITREDDEVVSTSETLTVPAGMFPHCLKIQERADDGATEFKFYAPGVGVIAEMDSAAGLLLWAHTTN
jgi:hypothetical protein